jgi:hypothetical protein
MVMMVLAGVTPDSSTIALLQAYQQRHLGQVGGMDEGVRILLISKRQTKISSQASA